MGGDGGPIGAVAVGLEGQRQRAGLEGQRQHGFDMLHIALNCVLI
jgi:hypothetical protein